MLGAIRRVTISATDLVAIEQAYSEHLEYQVSARSEVTAAEAQAWGAPATAGATSVSMRPAEAMISNSALWKALPTRTMYH